MRALSLLIKPASGSCNMRCTYCFYADVTDLRTVKNYGMMSVETLEILVKKALDEATGVCSFAFQGGEPTLVGLDFYRKLTEFQKKYNKNKVEIMNAIQTNGMLIDEEWAKFFVDNKFLVGISIDSNKAQHDSMRIDAEGKGTHTQCMRAVRLFEKHGVEFNVLTVLTEGLASHPDRLYKFYKSNNLRYIQFIPCIDDFGEQHSEVKHSLKAKTYGEFLSRFFDLWYEDFIKGDYYSIRTFDNYILMLRGNEPENCGMRGRCQSYPLIEADGSVYPCDFYVLDEHLMGNIKTDSYAELLSSDAAKNFMAPSFEVDEACKNCEYYRLCRGGCRRDRESAGASELELNRYCEGYKIFFRHAVPKMLDIARRM